MSLLNALWLHFLKTSGLLQYVRVSHNIQICIPLTLILQVYGNAEVLPEALPCLFFSVMSNYLYLFLWCCWNSSCEDRCSLGEVLCFSIVIWLSKVVRLLLWFFFSYFLMVICVYLRKSKVKQKKKKKACFAVVSFKFLRKFILWSVHYPLESSPLQRGRHYPLLLNSFLLKPCC